MKKFVVCGVGNRLRGDDAVGPMVVDELKKRNQPETVMLLDCGSTPERYAGKIIGFGPDIIIIIDAVEMNRMAGEVHEIPTEKIRGMFATTHKMPITLFIDYLQKSLTSSEIIFIGIQQATTVFGAAISEECQKSIKVTTDKVENISRNTQF